MEMLNPEYHKFDMKLQAFITKQINNISVFDYFVLITRISQPY